MTLNAFTSLSAEDQLFLVHDKGVEIGNREQTLHHIYLYQLYAFYVEIFFRKSDDTIWKVGGFDHPVLLKPYLDQIDLNELYKSK
jgi:hypothetical protein